MKLTKRQQELFGNMVIMASGPEKITNPYSKETVLLEPKAVAFYDVIIGSEVGLAKNPSDRRTFEIWQEAREVFRANWPKEFMQLID